MNILPFITLLILIFTLILSSLFTTHKQIATTHLPDLIAAYRQTRNTIECDLQEEAPQPNTPSPPKKESTPSDFPLILTENSKFNLVPLVKHPSPFLEEVVCSLLSKTYQVKEPLPLVRALIRALEAQPEAKTLAELVLPHPFNELWYTLLRASLSDDLTLRPKEESGVIVVQKASIPVLQAFFGETIAQEILTLEHGPNRGKKSYIKQDELTPILTAHNFPLAYRSFYTMGAKKGVTHTRKTIDKTHGITTKLSYKIGSGTSSPDATPTSHRSKPHASP